MSLEAIASADDVLRAARHLLGDAFEPPHGVVQTCAIDAENRVLRIGEHAPKSPWDFFMLHLARASVDTIVTTGKILRDEPTLRYDLEGPGDVPRALHAYRVAYAARTAPARVHVLTRGDVDLSHPALHGWATPVITLPSLDLPIANEARARGMEVLVLPSLDARTLVTALRAKAQVVSIEAGPSSSRALYDDEVLVSSLWISRYEGAIAEAQRGAPFLSESELEARFGATTSTMRILEPSGTWTFRSFARSRARP